MAKRNNIASERFLLLGRGVRSTPRVRVVWLKGRMRLIGVMVLGGGDVSGMGDLMLLLLDD
jgi:hypothetical protein